MKYRSDSSLERCKARLVAKGFTQKEGNDYHETFSPVVKFNSIQFLVSLVVKTKWNIPQFDVNNDFLHGDLQEEVYICLPLGIQLLHLPLFVELKKSLYSLKKASRQWYDKLSQALTIRGYQRSSNKYSLFLKKSNSSIFIIDVYVDDILVMVNDIDEI